VIGVLPGLGPVATIAMLLPSIYALDATRRDHAGGHLLTAAQYGGSTTSILINVPGESSSVSLASMATRWRAKGRPGASAGGGGPGLVLRRLRGPP